MILTLVALLLLGPVEARDEALREGDAEYARRGENARGGTADPRHVEAAVVHYRAALAADPTSRLSLARLLRALFFRAAFCDAPPAFRLRLLDEARRTGEESVRPLDAATAGAERIRRLRETPFAIDVYFWSAVAWGEWALAKGKLAAAREGAGPRIRDLAATVRDIDPGFEQGGGDRILGRLHDQSPRIPFLTGWVSRRAAIEHLERALALGPDNSVNRLFLAEALVDHAPERRPEARRLLALCVSTPPRPEYAVEDTHYAELARQDLSKLH